ncbi:2614_t:CDS:1, partial [Ambispora gerdemannii]
TLMNTTTKDKMSSSVVSTNYEYLTDNEILILQRSPYQLTLSIEELTKAAVKKRGNSDIPPRPQNSWIIFRRDYEAYLRLCNQHVKQNVKETAKECSLKWQNLSSEAKHFFKILEKIAFENYKRIYPNYKFKPINAKCSDVKKWIFREQTLSLRNNIMNDTTSTTSDGIHPFTINTNPDAAINTNICKAFFNESFTINNHNNVSR